MRLPLTLCVLVVIAASAAVRAEEDPAVDVLIAGLFAEQRDVAVVHGDFAKGAATVADGVLRLTSRQGKGGAGQLVEWDLSARSEAVPVVRVQVGTGHRAATMRLLVMDAGGARATYAFALADLAPGQEHRLVERDGRRLGDGGLDLTAIRQFQIQGDWGNDAYDLQIFGLALVPEDDATRSARERWQRRSAAATAAAERRRTAEEAQAQAQEQARAALLTDGADHPADGPIVQAILPGAPGVLVVQIQERELVRAAPVPYVAQEGDRIEEPKKGAAAILVHRDAGLAEEVQSRVLRRTDADGVTRDYAFSTPRGGPPQLWREAAVGTALTSATVDAPEAYRIISRDDARYADGLTPTAIGRKTRPLDNAYGSGSAAMVLRHLVYLELPHALRDGATYDIVFHAVNTQQERVTYRHDERTSRSEAIHVTQLGFRPDDPFKRAYLSLWKGTGGAQSFTANQFHILAADGTSVYEGTVVEAFAAGAPEALKESKDYRKTPVYWLDFPDFTDEGTFRIHVPGVGTSYPFTIGRTVYSEAFATAMHGLLSHRSGIALEASFTDYVRPRPMHPDEVPIYRVPRTCLEGETDAIRAGLREVLGDTLDLDRLQRHPNAWGGYMDAGDWDRRSVHLRSSYVHFELAELFPAAMAQIRLALPPDEAGNAIPDVVDEALFNIDCYRRLQEPDGGVGGGIESTAHPRVGEASWQESLVVAAFEPDPVSSLIYAACAAKAAIILRPIAPERAAMYGDTAQRAWAWAVAHRDRLLPLYAERSPAKAKLPAMEREADQMTALAAVELLRLTGRAEYHAAYLALVPGMLEESGRHVDALFTYAHFLSADQADPEVHAQVRAALIDLAETALTFQQGNAFQLTTSRPALPPIGYVGYWSVPEMGTGPVLPRVYAMTGDRRYLAGAVAATQYSGGANPHNMTMTTGVGHEWPSGVLHMDSRYAGLATPRGITVYGPSDPAWPQKNTDWAHTWYLSRVMVPDSRTWPGHEAYVGMFKFPAMNEYTIHQCFRGTSYAWGFLAARE